MMFVPSALLLCLLLPQDAVPDAVVSVLTLPESNRFALREVNGDGLVDLLEIQNTGITYRYLRADGSYPTELGPVFTWPYEQMAWDLVDLDGDGAYEVVTLSGEGEVRSWKPQDDGSFGEGELLVTARSYLPHGVSRMRFARDVDGNGRADLVMPAAGLFRIYLQSDDGSFPRVIEIEYEAEIDYQVGRLDSLESSFGQSLRIPWFSMDDVDGDGTIDLVSATEERIDFHLARPDLSSTPTWSLDLVALQGPPKEQEIDLEDLFSNIDTGVRWRIEDLDGEGARDLIVARADTIKVYLGGSATGVSKYPDQVLKLSGNLLLFFLRDVTGDGLRDLQLVRGERIGLSNIIQWLVLPGTLDFDLFTYANSGGTFARKPTRQNTIAIAIPRLLSFIDEAEEMGEKFEAQVEVPARRIDWDGDGERNDVADVTGNEVFIYSDCAEKLEGHLAALEAVEEEITIDRLIEAFLLEDVDRLDDGGTKTIDLGSIAEMNFSPGAALRKGAEGRTPTLRIEATGATGGLELDPVDLTGDGRQDLIAWSQLESGDFLVHFIVRP